VTRERLRVGIVGCGDVAHRHYLPALASRSDRVTLAAVADPRDGAGEANAAGAASWSPGTRVFRDLESMLATADLDAVFNLTPGPRHGGANQAILEAGMASFSEKPIAATVAEADRLIELATHRGVLLLGAPGSAVTNRVRWLKDLAESGRLGAPTLAVAHYGDPGPADWAEYTGDPTPFYQEGVGPVFDHGVYRLHEMTTVLGPVRRVQAMGSIALPVRRVRAGARAGQTIEVTTPDHVMMNLEFASGALGHVLASFATADTLAPFLEVYFAEGVVSFGGKSWDPEAPIQVHDSGGWRPATEAPRDDHGTVEMGARHFLACLLGEETPVLTAEHARHVLEIIVESYASIEDGRSHELRTTFGEPPQT
jgi:predicted dehydrogenase